MKLFLFTNCQSRYILNKVGLGGILLTVAVLLDNGSLRYSAWLGGVVVICLLTWVIVAGYVLHRFFRQPMIAASVNFVMFPVIMMISPLAWWINIIIAIAANVIGSLATPLDAVDEVIEDLKGEVDSARARSNSERL